MLILRCGYAEMWCWGWDAYVIIGISEVACLWWTCKMYIIIISWSHVTGHMMDQTWSGQFQIITDPASQGWLSHQSPDYLTFRINLPTFGLNFQINLLNQPTQSAFSLNWQCHWLVVRRFLWQTYVRRRVLPPTEVRMIQIVDLFADYPLVEAWSVSPSSTS